MAPASARRPASPSRGQLPPRLSVSHLAGASRTLLLTLYLRATESARPDALLRDDWAAGLVERLDFDFSSFAGDSLTQTAAALRAREVDRSVRSFVTAHPKGMVVELGCGLDTRLYRVDDGAVRWLDLDLPPVIDLREALLPPHARVQTVPASLLEETWTAQLAPADALLFVAEGVFPYLTEPQVRALVLTLGRCFPGALLLFDAVSPLQAALSAWNPTLAAAGASFRWGLADSRAVEGWRPGFRRLNEFFYLDQPEPRLTWLRLVPALSRGASVLLFRLGGCP